MDRQRSHSPTIVKNSGKNRYTIHNITHTRKEGDLDSSHKDLVCLNKLSEKKNREVINANDKSPNLKKSEQSLGKRKQYLKNPERVEYYNQAKIIGAKKNRRKTQKSGKNNSNSSVSQTHRTSGNKINRKKTTNNGLANSTNEMVLLKNQERLKKKIHARNPSMHSPQTHKKGKQKNGNKINSSRQSILFFPVAHSSAESKKSFYEGKRQKDPKSKTKSKKKSQTKSKPKKGLKMRGESKNKSTVKIKQKTYRNSEYTKSSLQANNQQKPQIRGILPTNSNIMKEEEQSLSQIRQNVVDELCMNAINQPFKLSNQALRQRFKSVSMMGKICCSMNLKRGTFLLALGYLQKYIDSNIDVKTIKAATIASLMIALKVQHAQIFGNLVFQLNGVPTSQSHTINFMGDLNDTMSNKKYSFDMESSGNKKPQLSVNNKKMPNVLNVVLSHEEIFSEYDRILCKEEITDMQLQIMNKMNFRLELKAMSHWVSSLYCLWEKYLHQLSAQGSQIFDEAILQKLPSLKSSSEASIVPYLYQLSQICQIIPPTQNIPKPTIVVSIIYLLIRIRADYALDEWEKGFQYFRSQLAKSANAIFIDRSGTNEIFGQYLAVIGLDMRHLVGSCQYVSKFLLYRVLKYAIDEWKKSPISKDPSLYYYSPELFRYFSARLHD